MIDLKITFRHNDFALCKQILEDVLSDLNWDYQRILNRYSYGGVCTWGKLSDDSARVFIDKDSSYVKAFLKTLCNYNQNVQFVEILYNDESEDIVYELAYNASPANTGEGTTGQYIRINYLIFKEHVL